MDFLKKELDYFFTAANEKSLTKAAEKLDVGQPHLSKVISKLEKEYNEKLFYRSKQGVKLTPEGNNLFLQIQKIKNALLDNNYDDLSDDYRGTYSMALHPVIAHYTLPKFLGSILSENQKLDIKVSFLPSREVIRKVVEGKIDIGIVINSGNHPDLVIKKITKEKSYIFTNSEKSSDILFYNPDMIHIISNLKKIKKLSHIKKMIAIANYHLIAELVNDHNGLGLLPEHIAKDLGFDIFYQKPFLEADVCLIYRYELQNNKTFKNLIAEVLNKVRL